MSKRSKLSFRPKDAASTSELVKRLSLEIGHKRQEIHLLREVFRKAEVVEAHLVLHDLAFAYYYGGTLDSVENLKEALDDFRAHEVKNSARR